MEAKTKKKNENSKGNRNGTKKKSKNENNGNSKSKSKNNNSNGNTKGKKKSKKKNNGIEDLPHGRSSKNLANIPDLQTKSKSKSKNKSKKDERDIFDEPHLIHSILLKGRALNILIESEHVADSIKITSKELLQLIEKYERNFGKN